MVEASEMLHGKPVDSGANVLLVRDFGELGVHGRAGTAQPLWLCRYGCADVLGEPRGEDAADVPGGRNWLVTEST